MSRAGPNPDITGTRVDQTNKELDLSREPRDKIKVQNFEIMETIGTVFENH